MLITVHSHGEKRRSLLVCESNTVRDLELLQGTFFSATSTDLLGGLLKGGSVGCMCVFVKTFVTSVDAL